VGDFSENKWVDGSPQKVAIHAIVGGLLSEATGGDFKTGAIAAGANEALVVQLDALVKNDPNLLTMSSQLVGLVAAAAVDGDIEKGAWVAQNATQYNYLTHAQEAEKDRELEGCKEDKFCRVEKATKWALIDAQQDLGILVGVGGGIGLSAAETAQGVFELVQHLPETVEALKQLASSPEFRQQFTDSYFSDLEQRAARLTQAYNDAGWQGSVTAGVEGARFAVELVGVLTAVRGTAQVAAKLPDAAKQVVNAIAEAPAAGGWKAQLGAAGDLGKVEFPSGVKGVGSGSKFVDQAKLDDHFARHGGDFGAKNALEYQAQADRFLTVSKPAGVLEKVRPNGDVVRYNPATDEFGVISSGGSISTYYKPDPAVHGKGSNLDYFNAQ
jgi:filamentous hemagglutinin